MFLVSTGVSRVTLRFRKHPGVWLCIAARLFVHLCCFVVAAAAAAATVLSGGGGRSGGKGKGKEKGKSIEKRVKKKARRNDDSDDDHLEAISKGDAQSCVAMRTSSHAQPCLGITDMMIMKTMTMMMMMMINILMSSH